MNGDHHPVGRPSGDSGTMTPPINSVSDHILQGIAAGDLAASPFEVVSIAKELAACRAANTPVGPELWGKYPDTGVWHQIADGTNTDEQVADFERCYAEAGWTELRRSNPFASPALPSQVVGLSVKPLEWGDHDSLSIIAHTVLGPYLVEVINSPRVALWLPNMTGQARKMIEGFDSVEDAKAAAQADFNARIQSCITSPAAEPEGNQPQSLAMRASSSDEAPEGNQPFAWHWWAAGESCIFPVWSEGAVCPSEAAGAAVAAIPLYTHPAPPASREVTENPWRGWKPEWSPDDAQVVFEDETGRVWHPHRGYWAYKTAHALDRAEARIRELEVEQPAVLVTDEAVERAAAVMWNDIFGARAGAWDNPPADSVSGIQFRATARAALLAALPEREG